MENDLLTFERAVLAQAPPRAVLAGASLSPDGKYGAALTVLPTAGGYLMDDVLVRTSAGWENYTGGSGGGISWTNLHEADDAGVLRYGDERVAKPPPHGSGTKGPSTAYRATWPLSLRRLEHRPPRGSPTSALLPLNGMVNPMTVVPTTGL